MNRASMTGLFSCVFLSILMIGFQAEAQDLAQIGRDILSKNQDALVEVDVNVKIQTEYGEGDKDSEDVKTASMGVILDSKGLVVAPLTTLNPAERAAEAMSQDSEKDSDKSSMKSQITGMKIRFSDGTLVPARVVLRDKDLDLAFIRPTAAPAKPYNFLDISQCGAAQVLDTIFVLARGNSAINRIGLISISRIIGVTAKPRTFYLGDGLAFMFSGVVFTADGKPLGFLVFRGASKGDYSSSSGGAVILPFSDILTASKQASPVATVTK